MGIFGKARKYHKNCCAKPDFFAQRYPVACSQVGTGLQRPHGYARDGRPRNVLTLDAIKDYDRGYFSLNSAHHDYNDPLQMLVQGTDITQVPLHLDATDSKSTKSCHRLSAFLPQGYFPNHDISVESPNDLHDSISNCEEIAPTTGPMVADDLALSSRVASFLAGDQQSSEDAPPHATTLEGSPLIPDAAEQATARQSTLDPSNVVRDSTTPTIVPKKKALLEARVRNTQNHLDRLQNDFHGVSFQQMKIEETVQNISVEVSGMKIRIDQHDHKQSNLAHQHDELTAQMASLRKAVEDCRHDLTAHVGSDRCQPVTSDVVQPTSVHSAQSSSSQLRPVLHDSSDELPSSSGQAKPVYSVGKSPTMKSQTIHWPTTHEGNRSESYNSNIYTVTTRKSTADQFASGFLRAPNSTANRANAVLNAAARTREIASSTRTEPVQSVEKQHEPVSYFPAAKDGRARSATHILSIRRPSSSS